MNTDNFKTQDFWLSAYLVASGVPLMNHRRSDGVSTFWFEDGPRAQGLMDSFYKLTARIEPTNFGRAIRLLKRTMYDSPVTFTTTNGNTNYVKQSGNSVL